jgi:hypothetical protein
MTTYESEIKAISSNEEVVFGILSDLRNLEKVKENPSLKDKAQDLEFDSDSCSFVVEGFGKMGFRVLEREPFKTIKLISVNAPVEVSVWIQLKAAAENDTRMKLTVKADLPMMIKMMVDKKLKEGVNSIADLIAETLSK